MQHDRLAGYNDRRGTSDKVTPGRKHRPDYWILILMIALLTIGVIVVYSISPALGKTHNVSDNSYILHQIIAIGLGAIAFAVTSNIPVKRWTQLCLPLLAVAGAATLIALITPVNSDYPQPRWIRIGGFSFQSVELVKFALLIWLAGLLRDRIKAGTIANAAKTLQPIIIALGIVGVLVAGLQSDLGSMVVIIAMVGMMAFVAGLPMKKLLLVVAVVTVGGILAISSTPYRRDRLAAYLHPTADCQNTGYQACQALITVGSGGVAGLGLGRGVQAYGYLPEAANDSIFAVYAEKFGFVGVVLLIGLFAAFFSRLKRLATRVTDPASRLIVMGILAWLAVQALINMGAMLGLLPLKGITLPLVSYGGTSVVFIMAAIGVVFHISKYANYSAAASADSGRANRPMVLNRQTFDPAKRPAAQNGRNGGRNSGRSGLGRQRTRSLVQ